jgi:hypothetical protein
MAARVEDGVDDTARWLLRRKALREARAAAQQVGRLPALAEPQPEPEPSSSQVLSPLFDLDRERAAAVAWAHRHRLLELQPEPEPQLGPEPEPEPERQFVVEISEPEPEPEPEIDLELNAIMDSASSGARASFRQTQRRRGSSPTLLLSTKNPGSFVADPRLKEDIDRLLTNKQQTDLADIFRVAAGSRETLDITRLRAVLRTIGCEQLCADVLQQLVELRRWIDAAAGGAVRTSGGASAWTPVGRRPPLPALYGMAVLDQVEGNDGQGAGGLAIGFEDFMRVMLSGKMRGYLGEMDFSHDCMSLLQLATAFDMAVDVKDVEQEQVTFEDEDGGGSGSRGDLPDGASAPAAAAAAGAAAAGAGGEKVLTKTDLMLCCTAMGVYLSALEVDQLWGILANAAGEEDELTEAVQAPQGAGWLAKEGTGKVVGLTGLWRRWANLSVTGRLDFREGPESRATDDAIEMVQAVRVVHAKTVGSRGGGGGVAGLRMLTDGVGAMTDLTGSVVSGAAKGGLSLAGGILAGGGQVAGGILAGGGQVAGGGLALAGDAAKGGMSLAGDAVTGVSGVINVGNRAEKTLQGTQVPAGPENFGCFEVEPTTDPILAQKREELDESAAVAAALGDSGVDHSPGAESRGALAGGLSMLTDGVASGVGAVTGGLTNVTGSVVSGAGGAVTGGVGRMRRISVSTMRVLPLPFLAEIEETTSPTKLGTADEDDDEAEEDEEDEEGEAGPVSGDDEEDVEAGADTDAGGQMGHEPEPEPEPEPDQLTLEPVETQQEQEHQGGRSRHNTFSAARRMVPIGVRRGSISEVFRGRSISEDSGVAAAAAAALGSPSLASTSDVAGVGGAADGVRAPPSAIIEESTQAEQEAEVEEESLVIHVVIRESDGQEILHVFECEDRASLERWLELLESSRSFHQNYHKTSVTFGEFLCGMASLKRTPLAHHFVAVQGGGGGSAADLLGSRPVDEQLAQALLKELSLMERIGVRVLQREQEKVDDKELMSRLQRASTGQLHLLTRAEQKQMSQIERDVTMRCMGYGALSASASGAVELIAGMLWHTTGMACDEGYATCSIELFWSAVLIGLAVASCFEILAIYKDSLQTGMRFVRVVGLQLLPLDEHRLFIACSIARAALELGNPEDALENILDPLREVSKLRMLLCAIIYKAKIGVTNFLLKVAMKRILSRSAARSVLPFLAVVGTAFWNGAVAIQVMREAKIRCMGVAAGVEIANLVLAEAMSQEEPMGRVARLQMARAVACTVVRKRTLHPNHQLLLTHVLGRLELWDDTYIRKSSEAEEASLRETYSADDDFHTLDDVGMFLSELPLLNEVEARAVIGLTCLAMVIDARATNKGLAFYSEVVSLCMDEETGATFPNQSVLLKELAAQFRRGKPIGAEAVIAAVGRRRVRTAEELLEEGARTNAEALCYCARRSCDAFERWCCAAC